MLLPCGRLPASPAPEAEGKGGTGGLAKPRQEGGKQRSFPQVSLLPLPQSGLALQWKPSTCPFLSCYCLKELKRRRLVTMIHRVTSHTLLDVIFARPSGGG